MEFTAEESQKAYNRVAGIKTYLIDFSTMDHGHHCQIRSTADLAGLIQDLKDQAESENDFAFDFSTMEVSQFPQRDKVISGSYER